jgi:hypothetical protein
MFHAPCRQPVILGRGVRNLSWAHKYRGLDWGPCEEGSGQVRADQVRTGGARDMIVYFCEHVQAAGWGPFVEGSGQV